MPLAEAIAEFLRSEELEVRVASTGTEALTWVAAFRPNIILCDLNLPDMSGLDLARDLRKNSATRDSLFVIHTASMETDIEANSIPEVDLLVSKPITPEKLERLLELEAAKRRNSIKPQGNGIRQGGSDESV